MCIDKLIHVREKNMFIKKNTVITFLIVTLAILYNVWNPPQIVINGLPFEKIVVVVSQENVTRTAKQRTYRPSITRNHYGSEFYRSRRGFGSYGDGGSSSPRGAGGSPGDGGYGGAGGPGGDGSGSPGGSGGD